jgi:hypothetical protein
VRRKREAVMYAEETLPHTGGGEKAARHCKLPPAVLAGAAADAGSARGVVHGWRSAVGGRRSAVGGRRSACAVRARLASETNARRASPVGARPHGGQGKRRLLLAPRRAPPRLPAAVARLLPLVVRPAKARHHGLSNGLLTAL